MGRGAVLEHEHELMLRSVEGAHAAIGLVPDAQVLEREVARSSGPQQFARVSPIDTDEQDGAIAAASSHGSQRVSEEANELGLRHFASGHCELTVPDAA